VTWRLRVGEATDVGRVRTENEDTILVQRMRLAGETVDLALVADGVGGTGGGAVASRVASERFQASLAAADATQLRTPARLLERAMRSANRAVIESATAELWGMATTLTALLIIDQSATVVHIGDSRAYMIREGTLYQVTQDHSWLEEQVRSGAMTRLEADRDVRRNLLTRALGSHPHASPDVVEGRALVGDRWVLCSDGLVVHVSAEEIHAVLTQLAEPQAAAERLVRVANARGGFDNISVVVLELQACEGNFPP